MSKANESTKRNKAKNKINLNFIHWIITILLLISVIYLAAMMRMAYIEMAVLKNLNWVNVQNTNNVMECVNKSDTECDLNKYHSNEKYWQEIRELYKNTPGS